MPKGVYLLGVGLALVALALAVTDWALSLLPGVTEGNVRRIRRGVALREAEATFGRPADRSFPVLQPGGMARLWHGAGGTAYVEFSTDRRVADARFYGHPLPVADPLARLRAWLGW
jgi:hypothetical protein